jgi:hypothetical protein
VPLQAHDVESALTSKGFRKFENDHHKYVLFRNGRRTLVRTKISHGEREISDKNCGKMARQMKITTPQFKDFVDCKIQGSDYVNMLVNQGILEKQPSS